MLGSPRTRSQVRRAPRPAGPALALLAAAAFAVPAVWTGRVNAAGPPRAREPGVGPAADDPRPPPSFRADAPGTTPPAFDGAPDPPADADQAEPAAPAEDAGDPDLAERPAPDERDEAPPVDARGPSAPPAASGELEPGSPGPAARQAAFLAARRERDVGIAALSLGGALGILGAVFFALPPCTYGAGNNCFGDARLRAGLTIAIPAGLLIGGGIGLVVHGQRGLRRARGDARSARAAPRWPT